MSKTESVGTSTGQIDWSTAGVVDAVLTVKVIGAPSSGWAERVEGVIALLQRAGSGWDEIKVTKKKIKVSGLADGCEHDVHHLLESAVQEANAAAVAREPAEETDPESKRDREMSEAFRAFAAKGQADEQPHDTAA